MRIIQIFIFFTVLGGIHSPSTVLAQQMDTMNFKMNRISFQTGLFHYFFDKAPILNINYLYPESTLNNPFRGFFISSIGIQYKRRLNKKSALSLEYLSFRNSYTKHLDDFESGDFFNLPPPLVYQRLFSTVTINYLRIQKISSKIDFTYGIGINYRNGVETIIISKGVFDLHLESSRKNDLGINTFVSIDYTPIPWLTLYSKFDFLGLFYLHDKKSVERFKSYSKMPNYYPSRFDLSFRLGIGVNF